MWERFSRTWRNRLFLLVAITGVLYVFAVWLNFGPEPVPFVAATSMVLTLMWLVFDIFDEDPAEWVPVLGRTSDRVDEATADLRILSSHQQSTVPSEAVRDRLVALARGRDPDLATALHRELATVRRLSPAEIDQILTRIEEARD